MLSRIGFVFTRLCLASFAILTASYCLLAYIPFTYFQIHLGGLLPWLATFAHLQPYLYWPAFLSGVVTLPSFRNDRTRSLSVFFIIVYGSIGLRLLVHPLLTALADEKINILWCVLSLLPLIWMGLLDWRAAEHELVWELPDYVETRRICATCLLTSAYVWLFSAVIGVIRVLLNANMAFEGRHFVFAFLWSLLFHLAICMSVFMALNFTLVLARLLSSKPNVHVLLCSVLAMVIVILVLQRIVFVRLSFNGLLSDLVAVTAAASIVTLFIGIRTRLYHADEGPMHSVLELLFFPRWLSSLSQAARAFYLIAGSAIIGYALIKTATFDWGHLIQILTILAGWAAVFGFFYLTVPVRPSGNGWGTDRLLIGAALPICLCMGVAVVQSRGSAQPYAAESATLLERYSHYDVSFLVARSVFSLPMAPMREGSLYTFLAANTNIPRSVLTPPVEVNLVRNLRASAGPKPNIFLFVIDSLRRDYLSPYNAAVNFTPAIGAFARDSVVMENAFTHYAGTGLSEPSIWAGAMLLHKQYVTPFYPMDSLQKLLDVEGYRQFITKDDILSTLLKPSPLITELDAGRPTMTCELCRTLTELQNKISSTNLEERPIFAYTQPQNIHISVINREERTASIGQPYSGFEADYAARIKSMDHCFGDFIQFLKERGIYENSVVILTSDHGDALGEEGRWGHAYNVVPEVVRVPLIVHLPAASRALAVEPRAPAFLTDITPSLYYLLGHRPIESNPIFGRPLFTESSEEAGPYVRDSYLIASSYAPIYAVLSNGGRSLYVVDGIEYNDYLYDMTEPGQARTVMPEVRANGQRILRDSIQDIANFYHFGRQNEPQAVN
ncbi:MAG: sulfatase-like hydrolase/transferase [Candidatus Korobacteraceae bacterium]